MAWCLSTKAVTTFQCVGMIPAVTAESDVTEVGTSAAFIEAMKAGGSIKLTAGFELTAVATVPAGVTVTLDLNGNTINSTKGIGAHIKNAGDLTTFIL